MGIVLRISKIFPEFGVHIVLNSFQFPKWFILSLVADE
ncbi:hypothetical protein LEP1GSC199_2615 [Leptospira vanthielii serovar Holland str. Waz Holland = ATCC 700522]|uniref:Uncharacterized protein n=1 Tax=Leptospira vanthielii serovar Holland str. Waz Holland = ATCC 700522 TaxID=1218591 RepID=N1W4T6_9LEPT|nr:hypothetical protein LEP1GSC199_2615 [Leptospira vanthielii serovar Holland str. Waz Holland = ATCC 700522]